MDENTARQRLRYLELKAKAGNAAPAQPEAKGALYAAGSGLVRSIPQTLDFAAGVVGEGMNQVAPYVGLKQAPFGEIYNDSTYFNNGASKVLGPEYDAQGFGENAAKLAGGVLGPALKVKAVTNFFGFLKGLGGSMDDFIRDPAKLKEAYQMWEKSLEGVQFQAGQLRKDLVDPYLEKMKFDLPTMRDPKAIEAVDTMKGTGQLPNARFVEGARRNLGGNPTGAAQKGRETIDELYAASGVGTEGRDAYRRAMLLEEVQHALRNSGNEGLKATRTKINNLDETGMTAVELAAKRKAGNPTTLESVTQGIQSSLGAIPSTIMAGPLAPLLYGAGKAVGAGGRIGSRAEMKALQEVLLNKRAAPNMGERGGAMARNAGGYVGEKASALAKALQAKIQGK